MDGECHKRTASHVRSKHKQDPDIPICDFFEVGIVLDSICIIFKTFVDTTAISISQKRLPV